MKEVIFFLLMFCYNPLLAQKEKQNLVPTIDYKTQEGIVSLNSTILSMENIVVELNYLFLVIKQTNGNLSNQRQEGKFVINPNEKKNLSEVKINYDDNTELKAYLFIRDENQNKLIAKDSLHLNFSNKSEISNSISDMIQKPEFKDEEIIIRGLVTDQTKTKMGRDFYDIFYSSYNLLNEKFPFIIEIYEQPLIGRNSMINISVDDKVIYSFNLMPKEDYMKELNQDLFRTLFMYSKNRTIINSY